MKQFTINSLPLEVSNIPQGFKLFQLTENYIASWTYNNKERTILVPVGFQWDGASVPQFLWSFTGLYPGGIMLAPSVIHDWIYISKGRLTDYITGETFRMTRAECDLLFKSHLEYVGMPEAKINIAYKGVKYLGWTYWYNLIKLFEKWI